MEPPDRGYSGRGYALAALGGAVAGGLAVAAATRALTRVTGAMQSMMAQ